MDNTEFLYENLPLLLNHADEILQYSLYYNSQIYSRNPLLKSMPLGPYIAFWKEVPVNTVGILLLTKEVFLGSLRVRLQPYYEVLLQESGFDYKNPMPFISQKKLKGILERYMESYQGHDYTIGVSLEEVVEELKAAKPIVQRKSYSYLNLTETFNAAITAVTGTEAFYSWLVPPFMESDEQYYPRRYFTSPVFYRIQQEPDLSLKLVIELQVPTKYPGARGFNLIASGNAMRLAEHLKSAAEQMEATLLFAGYRRMKLSVTLEETGIIGLYEKVFQPISHSRLAAEEVEVLGTLLLRLKAVLEQHGIWKEFQKVQELGEYRLF